MADRLLWFPDDWAAGFLEATLGDALALACQARGRIRVPGGASLHLWVKCPVRGLSLLNEDDVATIRLEKKTATDADFSRLAHLTALEELNASKSHKVGDAGLAAIASLRRLRALDLYASAVTDAGLAHIAGMAHLERGLQRLTYLKLDETGVGDDSVPHLLRLSALERLTLSGTRMTPLGLAKLQAGLPGLRELFMPDPGRRLAGERARAAVLGILARRLCPETDGVASPEEELRTMLPNGSRIAGIRRHGEPARETSWALDNLDLMVSVLPAIGTGYDLRIVTPNGMDV